MNLLFSGLTGEDPKERSIFTPPLRIPLSLSANFGELRADHFHSGIDLKTQGVTGKEVVATASGYVYRISVSPGGFGKALYLRHPSGYSTVYGHLDRFAPEIEKYVISRQYEEKSYMITLWPSRERFHFNKGDVIAYSGNSGSSSGPHLHYEVRKSEDEIPVNPLLFDFGVEDKFKPVIEKLAVYPVGRKSKVNGNNKSLKINVSGGNGNYYISSGNIISISGSAGFGIKSYDLLNSTYNKCSVFSIELKIDSITVYKYIMDSFGFNESRYINCHIDYETLIRENTFYERTYLLPNDRLGVYKNLVNRGIFNFNDNRKHRIEIIVADIHNNISRLTFSVKSAEDDGKELKDEDTEGAVVMPYGRNNKFVSGNLSINIPGGSLYDTLLFKYSKTSAAPGMYSDIYHVHNKYTPLHKPYHLLIKPENIPSGKAGKLLIIQVSDDKKKSALPTTWENGWLTANPGTFGNFYIGIDTIPPTVSPVGFTAGADLRGREMIRIKIRDDLSGIRTYNGLIDGRWALFEFDQKNDQLIYKFDQERIRKGARHSLSLSVTDGRDNKKSYECDFTW
jgi:hypothetical protein